MWKHDKDIQQSQLAHLLFSFAFLDLSVIPDSKLSELLLVRKNSCLNKALWQHGKGIWDNWKVY